MATSAIASSSATTAAVRSVYRDMLYHIRQVEKSSTAKKQKLPTIEELKQAFRTGSPAAAAAASTTAATSAATTEQNDNGDDALAKRLKEAESRLAVWRMTGSVKPRNKISGSTIHHRQVYIYKDGKRYSADQDGASTTIRDDKGRTISNFNGYNLDACQVKRHNYNLKKLGFVNNAHAKGIF